MKNKVLPLLLISILLAGCANNPPIAPASQLQGANYGPYPSNYQAIAKTYYSTVLFDPYSAHYRFLDKPTKGYERAAPVAGGKPVAFGYVVTACVNAKNRMGGYVGEKCERLLIRNGSVASVISPNMFFSEPWYR